MNYQDAVSLFRARYDRLAVKDSKLPKLTNTEILVELSVIQSDLQNKYMLSTKSSRDNSTPQTTLTAGTAVYLPGTSAGTIPNDILQIYNVSINDTLNSTLEPIGISFMRDYIKATGRPRRYVLRNQGQIFDAVMEFDTLPDQAYTLTILYAPRYDLFSGVSNSANRAWSDYDDSVAGWSGSFKLPYYWHNAIVQGALANVIGDVKLIAQYQNEVDMLLKYQPLNTGTEIPYNDGVVNTFDKRIIRNPGDDTPEWR